MRKIIFMLTTAFLLTACKMQAQDSKGESTEKSGLILFEKPGKKAPFKSFKVFQVLERGKALAREQKDLSDVRLGLHFGPVVLISDSLYYFTDDEMVKTDHFVQIGVYQYLDSSLDKRTVKAYGKIK